MVGPRRSDPRRPRTPRRRPWPRLPPSLRASAHLSSSLRTTWQGWPVPHRRYRPKANLQQEIHQIITTHATTSPSMKRHPNCPSWPVARRIRPGRRICTTLLCLHLPWLLLELMLMTLQVPSHCQQLLGHIASNAASVAMAERRNWRDRRIDRGIRYQREKRWRQVRKVVPAWLLRLMRI